MNAQQRYLFDLTGFLHLPAVLTPEQLQKARAAAAQYFQTPAEDLPADMGLEIDGRRYTNSFAFHKDLETQKPRTSPITNFRPTRKIGMKLCPPKPWSWSGEDGLNSTEKGDERYLQRCT